MKEEDRKALVDIRTVKIDQEQPTARKIRAFVEQIRDPYHFRVGDVEVRVSYAGKEKTLDDCFKNMLSML